MIFYLSSYVLGAQVGLLGVISLALALVTLVAQNEEAATDVKVYYHESMFLGIAASGVTLSAAVSAQFLWPLQALLHAVGGRTGSLVYRTVLVSVEVVWFTLSLAAVAHCVSTTFAFVQRDARERLRERYTANVVVPRDLLRRVRSNLYAAAGGIARGAGPKAILGFGSGVGTHVELEDDFGVHSAVVDLRPGLLAWVIARLSKRCEAPPNGFAMTPGGPTLWFVPRLDQPLDGRTVWCRRSGGVPLTVLECAGTGQAMDTSMGIVKAGGAVGKVGEPHYEAIAGAQPMFYRNVIVARGPAPVRAYIDELLPEIIDGRMESGRVSDRMVALDGVPDGYRAMNEREVLKVLIRR